MLLADPDVDCREAAVAQTEAPEVAQLVTGGFRLVVVEAKVTDVTLYVSEDPLINVGTTLLLLGR
jgi:hypothetical protein